MRWVLDLSDCTDYLVINVSKENISSLTSCFTSLVQITGYCYHENNNVAGHMTLALQIKKLQNLDGTNCPGGHRVFALQKFANKEDSDCTLWKFAKLHLCKCLNSWMNRQN